MALDHLLVCGAQAPVNGGYGNVNLYDIHNKATNNGRQTSQHANSRRGESKKGLGNKKPHDVRRRTSVRRYTVGNLLVVFFNTPELQLPNPKRAMAANSLTAGEPLCLMVKARRTASKNDRDIKKLTGLKGPTPHSKLWS